MNQTTGLTIPPSFRCISGIVSLFRFFVAPAPGSVIGQIQPVFGGNPVNLVQTQETPPGGTMLASVEGRFSTVCGPVVRTPEGQIALDVRIVNPGAPSPTGFPTTFPWSGTLPWGAQYRQSQQPRSGG